MLRPRDFLSFEAVYVCFLYAGVFKTLPLVGALTAGADLTSVMTFLGIGMATAICMTRPIPIYPKATQYLLVYLLFVCWAVISWALISPEASVGGEYSRRKVAKLIVMTSWAVIAPLLIIGSNERVHRVLLLTVAVGLLIAMPRLLKGSSGALGADSYQWVGRSCGTGAVILVALLAYESDRARRILYSLGLLPLTIVMFWSGARQAMVGFMTALMALSYALALTAEGRLRLRRYLAPALCVAVLVGGSALALMPTAKSAQSERIVRLFQMGEKDGFNPSKENRPQIMMDAVRLWTMHPLFGAGYGAYADFADLEGEAGIKWPHNIVLEVLCELGVIGLGFLLLLLGLPAVTWLRECRRPGNYVAVATGCACLFHVTGAMFSWDMTDNRIAFGLAAMIVANAGFRQMLDEQA